MPSYTFFSLWRQTWGFGGTWKVSAKRCDQLVSAKRCDQLHIFFAVQTFLNFWWDLESFDKKVWPVTRFFRCGDYLKFLRDLEKFSQKSVPSHTESFDKKMWPVTHFFCSADYLKFLMGLGKFRKKKRSAQLHVFFAVETNLSFWRDLEKFSQKSVPSHMFLRCGDYLEFLMGLRKISTKICAQLHFFFAVETNLRFWWDLESFGKKMWPVTHFFRSADFLKFLMELGKFRQKGVTSYTFFAVETILSVWGDLESFDKKMWPVTGFFRCGD